MRRVMVLVIAIAGCRHNSAAEVLDYPAPQPVTSIDVRPQATRSWWCYREVHEILGDGLCDDDKRLCELDKADHIKFDLLQDVERLRKRKAEGDVDLSQLDDGQIRGVAARAAFERYTECDVSSHAACFTGQRVVDRTAFELCYPTMKRCTFVEGNNRRDVDVSVMSACTPR